MRFFKELWPLLQVIAVRFVRERFTYAASALTFTTLLAIVPLMAVVISVLSAFPVFHALSTELQQFVFQNFIPAAGQVVQQYLNSFIQQTGKLSAVGTVILIVTSIMMMLTIEHALNDIWKIDRRRYSIAAIVRYWAVLSLVPIMIGLTLMAMSYVVSLPLVTGAAATLGMKSVLLSAIPFILTVLALTLLYVEVPNCKVPTRYGLIGAIIATTLFELAKKGFVMYLTHFPTYKIIYGALATIPIFFIWVYLSWVIILFGALVSNVLTNRRYVKGADGVDGFTLAFLWLGFLWKAQQEGKGLKLSELYKALPGNYQVDPLRLLTRLINANFITVMQGDRYMLMRDFHTVTLKDLYEALPYKLPTVNGCAKYYSERLCKLFASSNQVLGEHIKVPLSELF